MNMIDRAASIDEARFVVLQNASHVGKQLRFNFRCNERFTILSRENYMHEKRDESLSHGSFPSYSTPSGSGLVPDSIPCALPTAIQFHPGGVKHRRQRRVVRKL